MDPLQVWGTAAGLARGGAPDSPILPPITCTRGFQQAATNFSIKEQYAGAHVLLTGASGYIGSVILEQLLRSTDVGSVRCLMRDKRDQTAEQRLAKLLQGPLFHKVRDNKNLISKVSIVQGDIMLPELGFSVAERSKVLHQVDIIIHCAADIRLECCIQETLQANYEGSRTMLELASACHHLRAYVHVSSAFVNMNFPRHSLVQEVLYPLTHGDDVVRHEDLAQELLHLSKGDANRRAEVYIKRWNFPNTYTLGKHLAEQLVASYQSRNQLPIAIVRPSLVSAIAGEPYPGYVGNWAGPIGAGAAMAAGLFDCLASVASRPLHVWDVVPADQVGSIIIASAAALAAGMARRIAAATAGGTRSGGRLTVGTAQSVASSTSAESVAAVIELRTVAKTKDGMPGVDGSSDEPQPGNQIASHPSSRGDLPSPPSSPGTAGDSGSQMSSEGSGPISPTAPAPAEVDDPSAAAGAPPLLVVHAATSTTYPITLMEGWNYNLDFFAAHPPVFSITPWKLPTMPADFEPQEAAVMSCRRWTGYKVQALTSMMKLFGMEREAKKLSLGFETFCVHNNAKTDRDLLFTTHNLQAMAALLNPAEAHEFLLVWKAKVKAKGRDGKKPNAALGPVGGVMSWRRYCHTQMAGIYKVLYGKAMPQLAEIPGTHDDKMKSEEDWLVRHDFTPIK